MGGRNRACGEGSGPGGARSPQHNFRLVRDAQRGALSAPSESGQGTPQGQASEDCPQ